MKLPSLRTLLVGAGALAVAAATAFQMSRVLYESPSYEVLDDEGRFELRQYSPRIVARTTVQAPDRRAATSEGFSRLGGYIFGGNVKRRAGPVETSAAKGERIAMTTPVESVEGDAGWVVAFTMPQEYDLDTLPKPRDARVELARVEGELVASVRFGGRATPERVAAMRRELEQAIASRGLEAAGPSTVAVYDPPMWVLPPFRRNEVNVPVRRL